MKKTKYHIYCGVINYTILLDFEGKIELLRVGNSDYYYRKKYTYVLRIMDHLTVLKEAFKFMIVTDPKEFKKLYAGLKENDPEMYKYAKQVVDELEAFCTKLSK